MQFLTKCGLFRKSLNYARISRFFISSSYYSTGLFLFKADNSSPRVQGHDIMKLPYLNFSTTANRNGLLQSLKKRLNKFLSSSTKTKMGGALAYEKCADNIDYQEFFKFLDLPDSFQSWFLIVQLHVWMCSLVRITESTGVVFRNFMVDSMWVDVETRLDHLKEVRKSHRKKFLSEIADQFRASQIAYDEGFFSDDTVLAAALWRTIFGLKNVDPRVLETLVFYIRKQIDHLDHQNSEEMLFRGAFDFIPLKTIIDKMNTV